ncbi:MAG: 4-alpha-glucanotransferase [Acidimicrobiales bacterium]
MTTDAWGIDDGWHDVQGEWHQVPQETVDAIRAEMGDPSDRPTWAVRPGAEEPLRSPCRLTLEDGTDAGELERLPPDLPLGIHELAPLDGGPTTTLLLSPGRCHLPDGLREWGVTMQVPTARSSRSWGIGDLADVRAVGEWVAKRGGQVVALSPLHAPTPVPPIATSPYYPSSRRWRSPLLIRVDEVGPQDEVIRSLADQARAALADPLVRRDECWARQREALEHLWGSLGSGQRGEAEQWARQQGHELERWGSFCALAEVHGPDWREWPSDLRHPDSPAVRGAVDELADRVAFHSWLQLLVEDQLDRASGAGVRLIQDLAVGVDPGGADAWIWQDLLAPGFSIGAPPDEFEQEGQSWALPPWIPSRLRDVGYRPLASLLRAAMVRGGGLRIDHVMGLTRLFWVPEGGGPRDGAYVRFAGHELLEVVALESARAGAIVVGEDLGTVEEGLRDELRDRGILSTKVVWFEEQPPEGWPPQSLAMATTHDLPTIAGMVHGSDAPDAMRVRLERLVGPLEGRPLGEIDQAVHHHLGRSPSVLALATLEDLLEVEPRPNEPGTTDDERPNWSQALPVLVDDLPLDPGAGAILSALAAGRDD